MAEDTVEVEVTLKAKVSKHAMFLKVAGAEVSEGEYEGTSLCSSATSGSPIVSVTRNGQHVGTIWFDTQSLIGESIAKVTEVLG